MRLRTFAPIGSLLALFAAVTISGDAAADPVDVTGTFTVTHGANTFLFDFPGHTVSLNGPGTFSFDVWDGTTGTAESGSFAYPPAMPTGLAGINVTFESGGAPVPLSGTVDAGHGSWTFTFTGRLRFTGAGFAACVTPRFSVTISHTGTNPPGSNLLWTLHGSAITSVDKVTVSGSCPLATANAINSGLSLGTTNNARFWIYQASVNPAIQGSY
jgi:hypothetical protein